MITIIALKYVCIKFIFYITMKLAYLLSHTNVTSCVYNILTCVSYNRIYIR